MFCVWPCWCTLSQGTGGSNRAPARRLSEAMLRVTSWPCVCKVKCGAVVLAHAPCASVQGGAPRLPLDGRNCWSVVRASWHACACVCACSWPASNHRSECSSSCHSWFASLKMHTWLSRLNDKHDQGMCQVVSSIVSCSGRLPPHGQAVQQLLLRFCCAGASFQHFQVHALLLISLQAVNQAAAPHLEILWTYT